MYRDPETEMKPAAPILEFGTANPSCAITMGRTVKASTNTLTGKVGLVKSVGYKHGDRMDQFAPAPPTCSVAQVGILLSDTAQKES
jgi:hypothetical protein